MTEYIIAFILGITYTNLAKLLLKQKRYDKVLENVNQSFYYLNFTNTDSLALVNSNVDLIKALKVKADLFRVSYFSDKCLIINKINPKIVS